MISFLGRVDPARVVAELRELHALTGDDRGAQRLCWTATWAQARKWLRARLEELPVQVETDPAGNAWATLPGERPEAILIGGHIDSVPDGGWLDGVLGLVAGLEVLRALAAGPTPPVTVKLVDWADEEGARFGHSMLGSSAAGGRLDTEAAKRLRDGDGAALPDVLAEHGVDVDRMPEAAAHLRGAIAYLELHIEQGPVLERLGLPLAAVLGTCGVERHAVRFRGQMAHVGAPMEGRRDPLVAAARLAVAVRDAARAAGRVATVGRCAPSPGIPTAVAAECEIAVDLRHPDAAPLADALEQARRDGADIAAQEDVEIGWARLWGIDPIAFHPELVDIVDAAIADVAGTSHRMPSPILHDAAEVSRAGVPTAMLFVQSLRGLSHAKEEDTRPEHLELSARALAAAVERTLAWA